MSLETYIPVVNRAKDADIQPVLEAANRDGWGLNTYPTHVVKKGDEYVGYWSMGNVPFVLAWHKNSMNVRETLQSFASGEAILSDRGVNQYIVPLVEDSPYCQYMEKMGYKEIGTAKLYIKEK